MGMGKKVTIGYKYYMDIQMGVSRGPVDELCAIKVGDLSAWTGSVTDNASITIDAPNLFGGEKKEGGIQGTLQVFMGAKSQVYPASIKNMLGGIVPSFRGLFTMYFSGMISAMNPYPKAWKFRVRRSAKGWEGGSVWNSSRVTINMTADDGSVVKAMNPAHIMYEGMTNSAWGRRFNASMLDNDSYTAAAQTLYTEGFGLNLLWSRQSSIAEFMQTVLDHIGAVHYLHPRTGKFVLKLIRNDYVAANLKLWDYSNGIVAIEDFTQAAPDTSINSVAVTYTDPVSGDQATCAPVQNMAAITISGSVNEQSTSYLGVPNYTWASRLAERDLAAAQGFLRKMTIHMDRRGWDKMPGDVMRIAIPEKGITSMVVRIGKTSSSSIVDGGVALTVMEDVFGLPATSTVKPQLPGWTPPDYTARAVTYRKPREMSYRDLYRSIDQANFNLIGPTEAYVSLICARPAGLGVNYDFYTNYASGGYIEQDTSDFAPNAIVASAIPIGAADIIVNLSNGVDLDTVVVGQPALIDNEEFVVKALNLSALTATLGRGCLDSVPAAHAAGSRIWFYEDSYAFDQTAYVSGVGVQMKALTRTSQQLLALASAPADSLTTFARQGKPYPPGNLKLNNMTLDNMAPFERPGVFTWAHRNKEVQMDQLYTHQQGSFALPSGLTYTVRILKLDGTVLRTVTGLTATTWTYDATMIAADGLDDNTGGAFRFQLWAVQNSVQSWQMYDLSLVVIKPGFGNSFGYYFGGASS